MTDKEKTIFAVSESSLSAFISSVAKRLKSRGTTLEYLPEVLSEIADELINSLEDSNATS